MNNFGSPALRSDCKSDYKSDRLFRYDEREQAVIWIRMKDKDILKVENMLRDIEDDYVSACGRFPVMARDHVWMLCAKDRTPRALIINSRSTLMPVLCGLREIPPLKFLKGLLQKKRIHSVQGLKEEVLVMEKELGKMGKHSIDVYDYDLMTLDSLEQTAGNDLKTTVNLRVPALDDLDVLVPLRTGYEKEEVLPKGSMVNPAACRATLINIISNGKILVAELDGHIVGKIIVNAVSFTRCQIGGVYVDPAFRGRGIARCMTQEFVASLINEGKGVTLFVKKNNLPAQRLYLGLGFNIKDDYRITYY